MVTSTTPSRRRRTGRPGPRAARAARPGRPTAGAGRRPSSEPGRQRASHRPYRHVVFAMIVTITIINYIDRGAISYAANDMIAEFDLDAVAWGNVLGYFGYGYIIGALVGGAMADRRGPRWVWISAVTAWSLVEMAMAYAGNLGIVVLGGSALAGFAVVRVLFGFTEGPLFSTTNRTMANWATVKERGLAASLGLLGTPLGAVITAPVAVALLSITHSWRALFIVLGVLGLVWVLVWRRMFTNMPEDNPRVSPEELAEIRSTEGMVEGERSLATEAGGRGRPLRGFFTSPTLVCNAIGYFGFQYVNFMILTWTPKYLQDEFGFHLSSLWYLGMIPWIGACFTVVIGGRLSDWLRLRTGSLWLARSGLAAGSLLLTAAAFSLVPLVHNPWGILAMMAVGNALNFLPNSVYWTVVIDTAPLRAGSYGGISHAITNVATIVAPTLTGYLVARSGYGSMFVATAVAAAVGMVAMLFVRPGVEGLHRARTA